MRIAVDLDGVLADTVVKFCEILNSARGWKLTPRSLTQWSAWRQIGISKDEFFRTLDGAWFDWRNIPPTEDDIAKQFLKLRKYGKIDIVTGRSRQTVPFAKAWLRNHGIVYSRLVVTPSTISKATLDYDVFVDDSSDLMVLLSRRNDRWGVLYTQPWNRSSRTPDRIYRVRKWRQIPDLIPRIQMRLGEPRSGSRDLRSPIST